MEAILIAAIPSLFAGGALTEVVRRVSSKKSDDFSLYRDTWQEEMRRVYIEVDYLRQAVDNLQAEVERLGGNPITIMPKRER